MVVGALPETFALDDRPVCWLSLGATIYLGPPLDLGGHARMVGALILGISGPVMMTTGGRSVCVRSVFIPAQAVMEFVEVPERVAVCTFDPTVTRVANCTDGMRESGTGVYTGHRNEHVLVEMFTQDVFIPYGVLQQLGVSPPSTRRPVDQRITLLGEQIRSDPQTTVSASEAAATVGLSLSYLLTLFAAETGTTFRRYRLWVRLIHAATAVAEGKSLTQASADAGFASPSHLSDTARALLGVSTTAALATGARLLVDRPPRI